jgi:3-oxoacyl-[acyl-carrier protein] reductase
MINPGLQGKVAVVTGANHGLGAASARALAAQGCSALLNYLRLPESATEGTTDAYRANRTQPADEVLAAIRDSGGTAEAWESDLADPATIPALFDQAEQRLGPVEILVNNAAHWEADTFVPVGLVRHELDQWPPRSPALTSSSLDRHFAVNSRAVALTMAEFARRHVARGAQWGRIINISTDGADCFPAEVSYGASKAALESLSRTAAAELGRWGITVNIIAPGPIQTAWITPELEKRLAEDTPLGRVGLPDDVADVVVFLDSEQARWLSGQLLYVGGGHRM